jgi:hypothetical protein
MSGPNPSDRPQGSVYDAEAVPPDGSTLPPIPHPAARFRPTARPPVAVLVVCDDGRTDGEVIRLRDSRFVIGRAEGDLVIPHDDLISARHVEITREPAGRRFRWVVADLGSTNGLFVRAGRAKLGDGGEFLVGRGRFRFEAASTHAADTETADYVPPPDGTKTTLTWGSPSPRPFPALVEVVGGGVGVRVVLTKPECWIGSDPLCMVYRAGDPFVSPRHARLYRDPRGRWHVRNNKSVNGVWVRTARLVVESACAFQIGEQRFRLRVG